MLDLLAGNPLLLLFTVIGLGYLIGSINIFGFKLGVAAVLFVGIFFGAIDSRLSLPEHIYIIGLVLFVYAIGTPVRAWILRLFPQTGASLQHHRCAGFGCRGAAAILIRKFMGLSAPSVAGLFCGALTNTPALAAAVETAKNLSANLPPDTRALYVNSPVVTYGLAYPFGVFGVILWFFISNKLLKTDSTKETVETRKESTKDAIFSRTFKITNPAIWGKTVENVLAPIKGYGFVLSRIKKASKTDIVLSQTILEQNDCMVAVGMPTPCGGRN